jgi:predicted PP-loop superfamily ATPase
MSIQDEIEKLRQELPCVYSNPPHILSILENEKISILAADRPDKSVIIGPGGYIAGHLAKLYGKPLSITAYTDELIKDFRKKESEKLIHSMDLKDDHKEIIKTLRNLLTGEILEKTSIPVAVALSGGRDSLASAILLKDLFSIKGLTVFPSDMILPPHVRDSVDESVRKLDIEHRYIPADFSEIVERSLNGRIHPCGHCHTAMSDILIKECSKNTLPALVFGELLPTGSQSLKMVNGVLIINLPALLALTKRDTTTIASNVTEYTSFTVECPLLKAVNRRFPAMKYATVKRVLREVRAGVLEPGEALQYLKPMIKYK